MNLPADDAARHGSWVWDELACPDPPAAARFYGALFHWTRGPAPAEASLSPPEGPFWFLRDGVPVGGCLGTDPPLGATAEPAPGWRPTLVVPDLEATRARALSLGATPLPRGTGGEARIRDRVAVLRDPLGGILRLLPAGGIPGGLARRAPGTFCWHELAVADRESATRFYEDLLGWEPRSYDVGETVYTVFVADDLPRCGMMQLRERDREPNRLRWRSFVSVLDVDLAIGRARDLGATVVTPPTDVPLAGRFAVLRDPQGVEVSVLATESSL